MRSDGGSRALVGGPTGFLGCLRGFRSADGLGCLLPGRFGCPLCGPLCASLALGGCLLHSGAVGELPGSLGLVACPVGFRTCPLGLPTGTLFRDSSLGLRSFSSVAGLLRGSQGVLGLRPRGRFRDPPGLSLLGEPSPFQPGASGGLFGGVSLFCGRGLPTGFDAHSSFGSPHALLQHLGLESGSAPLRSRPGRAGGLYPRRGLSRRFCRSVGGFLSSSLGSLPRRLFLRSACGLFSQLALLGFDPDRLGMCCAGAFRLSACGVASGDSRALVLRPCGCDPLGLPGGHPSGLLGTPRPLGGLPCGLLARVGSGSAGASLFFRSGCFSRSLQGRGVLASLFGLLGFEKALGFFFFLRLLGGPLGLGGPPCRFLGGGPLELFSLERGALGGFGGAGALLGFGTAAGVCVRLASMQGSLLSGQEARVGFGAGRAGGIESGAGRRSELGGDASGFGLSRCFFRRLSLGPLGRDPGELRAHPGPLGRVALGLFFGGTLLRFGLKLPLFRFGRFGFSAGDFGASAGIPCLRLGELRGGSLGGLFRCPSLSLSLSTRLLGGGSLGRFGGESRHLGFALGRGRLQLFALGGDAGGLFFGRPTLGFL